MLAIACAPPSKGKSVVRIAVATGLTKPPALAISSSRQAAPDFVKNPARPPRRFEEQPREACRLRHYSLRTEEACWIRFLSLRFLSTNGALHPSLGPAPQVLLPKVSALKARFIAPALKPVSTKRLSGKSLRPLHLRS